MKNFDSVIEKEPNKLKEDSDLRIAEPPLIVGALDHPKIGLRIGQLPQEDDRSLQYNLRVV
jgi:hypothetical protein